MFAERLKQLREESGLSQREFAKVIGVERTRYGKWETKGFEPPYDVLIKIADYFDVSLDYLLGRSDNRKTPSGMEDVDVKDVSKVSGKPLTETEIEAIRRFLSSHKD